MKTILKWSWRFAKVAVAIAAIIYVGKELGFRHLLPQKNHNAEMRTTGYEFIAQRAEASMENAKKSASEKKETDPQFYRQATEAIVREEFAARWRANPKSILCAGHRNEERGIITLTVDANCKGVESWVYNKAEAKTYKATGQIKNGPPFTPKFRGEYPGDVTDLGGGKWKFQRWAFHVSEYDLEQIITLEEVK